MKPLIQKLPNDEGSSFVARFYRTPIFETPWHIHEALELVLCVESYGKVFIGNFTDDYSPGEIYFIGKNLPHWFRKRETEKIGCSLVIQFEDSLLGSKVSVMPEFTSIKKAISVADSGIKLKGDLHHNISQKMIEIEQLKGFDRLIMLLDCLREIGDSNEYDILSKNYTKPNYTKKEQNRISLVYEYTLDNFKSKISLEEIASLTNQSVSNFCKFFKKNTKKTYVEFLNEIRVDHACKLLHSSEMLVSEICYSSGFKNLSNFSTQFRKVKGVSPTEYRNEFKKTPTH